MEATGRFSLDAERARLLLAEQCPTLSDHEIVPYAGGGTTYLLFRLGTELAIRFPVSPAAALQCRKELTWLPRIAAAISIPVPTPVFAGEPTEHFPAPWSVVRWMDGEAAWTASHVDHGALVSGVGAFIADLSAIPTMGGPAPGDHCFGRGVPLAKRDNPTRTALHQVADIMPLKRLEAIWEHSLSVELAHDYTWIHGDLHGGNLIIDSNGGLNAVIDFGGLAVGDPACDLAFAWYELPSHQRRAFRSATKPSDDCWDRARGWALSVAAIQLPYYRDRHPEMERLARRTLNAVLEDEE